MFQNIVDSIDAYAFYRCSALEKADFPLGVKCIGRFAFADCTSLSFSDGKINALEKINSYAFRNCESLKEVCLHGKLKEIAEGSFEGCSSLNAVTLPDSLLSIRKYAFSGCRSLKRIQIPESVQYIYQAAFAQSGIVKITLPASVREVKIAAFGDCRRLAEVIIQNPDTLVSPEAFCSCHIKKIQGAKWQIRRVKRGSAKRYREIPLVKRSHVGTNVLSPRRKPLKRQDLELPDGVNVLKQEQVTIEPQA